LVIAEARSDDLADRGILRARTAERELVELLALLLDAENPDMADMVVAAGIDAARDLDLEVANLALPLAIGEPLRDALRHRDRPRIGERAIIEAGAGDDVGHQAGIGGRQPRLGERAMEGRQVVQRDM